jgi:hypothetical protein
MASYTAPSENLAIFDPTVFINDLTPITIAEGDKRYLRFPFAQGTEYLATIFVGGVATFSDNTIFTDNWVLNDTQTTPTRTISATCLPATDVVLELKADTGGAVFEETNLTQNGVAYTAPAGTTTTATWADIIASTGSTNTLQQILDNGNTATGANANIGLTTDSVGGLTAPQLTLNNNNTSATLNVGFPTIEMYKSGRNAQTSETLGSISVFADDGGSQKTEFARIQVKTENVASGNEDGTISFFTSVNGTNSEVFNFNGAQNENNSFRPLDLNGNALRTNSGDMAITTASSSGTGDLTITAKNNITLTPTTFLVLSTQIQMPTTSGTISYSTITGFLSINFASQSTGYFELSNLGAGSISGLTLTNGRIGGKYHILLRGQSGFNWSPSTSSTFKANNYSLTAGGNQWIGLDIYFTNTLSQYLVNATLYT